MSDITNTTGTTDTTDNSLVHFGVKGMRWGHRKADDFSSVPRRSSTSEILAARQTPEAIIASRRTTGEKAARAVVYGAAGATLVSAIAVNKVVSDYMKRS